MAEQRRIKRLWVRHSIAEDRRDIDGLVATLAATCVYEIVGTGLRWEGHDGARAFYTELFAAFPEAYQRIQAAIDFLKKEKGVERIYLMGHSMGGRMTSGFLANQPDAAVVGFIGVGLSAGGKEPVNTNLNLRKVKVPVLDVYGDNEMDAKAAGFRKPLVSDRFTQVEISGAKHDYRGYDRQVAEPVVGWLKKQEGR